MPLLKLSDFPMVYEVRDEYKKCRQNGVSRADSVQILKHNYQAERTEGREDDALLFWIGLAEGQCYYKELTNEVSEQALSALALVANYDWELSQEDISKRQEKYCCAPMPENTKIRKNSKFHCKWKYGDTFAYQLSGEMVSECGLSGQYLLLRKVDEMTFSDGRILPVVILSICPTNALPTSSIEYNFFPSLRLENGRLGTSKTLFEYRIELIIGNTRSLNKLGLKYLGNFADAEMPNDLKILNMLKVFSIILFSGLIISAVIRLGFSWIYFSMVIPMLIVVIGLFYLLTDKMNFNYSELRNTKECVTGSIIGATLFFIPIFFTIPFGLSALSNPNCPRQ